MNLSTDLYSENKKSGEIISSPEPLSLKTTVK